jgi:hypothetical protein
MWLKNQYKPWEPKDIDMLEIFMRDRVELKRIANFFGRTPRAITHAMRHVVIQQSMRHGSEPISAYHGINHRKLCDHVVPKKYYVEPEQEEGGFVNTGCAYSMFVMLQAAVIIGGFYAYEAMTQTQ